jgi:N-acetylglucosamine-6-phosphate deacetylase
VRLGVTAALLEGVLVAGDVAVEDGHLAAAGLPVAPGAPRRTAVPGLVDVQVNGGVGVDLLAADVAGVHAVGRALARSGVLAWLPTLVTAPEDATRAALAVLAEAAATLPDDAARPLGVHLEGPFLAPDRLGVHDPRWWRDPTPDGLARLVDPSVRMVTLAPERPGADYAIAALAARGVTVSLGHSDATATDAGRAVDAGARSVTHAGNAMRPLTAREPGLLGVALTDPRLQVQVILDGHHLAPEVERLVLAATRGRFVLVSDAVAVAGADGPAALGGQPVTVVDGVARRDDGTIAGSVLTLDLALPRAVAAGADPVDALLGATARPAALAGDPAAGLLRVGGPADLVVLDDDLAVVRVLRAGREVPR